MTRALVVAAAAALAGCGAVGPTLTRVPVPVACAEPVPERPLMPTDALSPGVDPFTFITHAQAEIGIRQAHEDRLLAALEACRRPLIQP